MTEKQPKKVVKTIDVMAAVKKRNSPEVIVPGEVAEIRFPYGSSFTTRTAKLFVRLLDELGPEVVKPKTHEILLSDINFLKLSNSAIKDIIAELQSTQVILTRNKDEDDSGPILTDVKRRKKEQSGVLYLNFSDTFRRVVNDSTYWAAISAKAVYLMEGKYSPWLYQMAQVYCKRHNNTLRISVDDLREQLGANTKKSYARWINFKNAVLDPAIAEVNQLTEVIVDYNEGPKKRNKVVEIELIFHQKSEEQLKETRHEQNLTRLGRKKRRTGQVEEILVEKENAAGIMDKNALAQITDPIDAWAYIQKKGYVQITELEPILMKDQWVILEYAKKVLGNRWIEAEEALTDQQAIRNYSDIFDIAYENDAFVEGMSYTSQLRIYAGLLGERSPKLEKRILQRKDASEAAFYAHEIINGPWHEAEAIINTDQTAGAYYAAYVIKDKWHGHDPKTWFEIQQDNFEKDAKLKGNQSI